MKKSALLLSLGTLVLFPTLNSCSSDTDDETTEVATDDGEIVDDEDSEEEEFKNAPRPERNGPR